MSGEQDASRTPAPSGLDAPAPDAAPGSDKPTAKGGDVARTRLAAHAASSIESWE